MTTPTAAEIAKARELRRRVSHFLNAGREWDADNLLALALADARTAALVVRDAEVVRLTTLLNTPEILDFIQAVQIEAAHQRERWGEAHDADKTPDDWLWAVAFLTTKATQAARYGDREKYLHHIVTAAAALANWHRHALAKEPT
jgi:hypothetical protein